MARSRLWTRLPPVALGLAAVLAIPSRASTATPDTLPAEAAAIRAGADLWFDEHLAPSLRALSPENPGLLLGAAAPAPDNPLPARAIGRRWLPALVSGGLPPQRGEWSDPIQPVGFAIRFSIPHA
jgi:hypothetical protein